MRVHPKRRGCLETSSGRPGIFLLAKVVGVVFLLCCSFFLADTPSFCANSARGPYSRILSITPAGTEILFDLGLGDCVVGVTKYCTWPPEAADKPDIGDMMHVNLEVVAGLKPDLVLLSNMNEHLRDRMQAMGYPVAVVHQDNFAQICDSIAAVGEVCGIPERAAARVRELHEEVAMLSSRAEGFPPPRVLVVVGRDTADELFRKVYVAGKRSFYNDLLGEARAENVFTGDVQYAQISREGLLRLNPDIVIELLGEHGGGDWTIDTTQAQWSSFRDLRAARSGDVALIKGDFTLRAGPRYPLVLDAFIRVIHGSERRIEK